MSHEHINKTDQTKSPYYKPYLTKTERYLVRAESRRLKHAKDYNQSALVLETILGREGTPIKGMSLNQRQKRKRLRWSNQLK